MKRTVQIPLFAISILCGLTISAQNRQIIKGDDAFKLQNYTVAAGYYIKALESGDVYHDLYLLNQKIGDCYQAAKKYELASAYYEKYLKLVIVPEKEIVQKYAAVLLNQGKVKEAKEQFTTLSIQNPEDEKLKRMIDCCDFAEVQLSKSNAGQVINLELINSPQSEFGPAFYNGSLIFASKRINKDFSTIDIESVPGFSDFYIAGFNKKLQHFANPQRLKGEINSAYDDGTFTFSPVTKKAYLTHCSSNRDSCRIFQARFEKNRWVDLKLVSIGGNEYNYAHPSLSSDGKILYFTSDMPGGKGGKDLWKATVTTSGNIIDPVNLGILNSSGDDVFPFILGDSVLFFASDGHPGMGGLDIFYSHCYNNLFEKPVNAGAPVNSTADDFGIILKNSLDTSYFCSNRNTDTNDDIFAFYGKVILDEKIKNLIQPARGTVVITDNKRDKSAVETAIPVNDNIGLSVDTIKASRITTTNTKLVPVTSTKIFYRVQITASFQLVNTPVKFSGISGIIDIYGLSVEKADRFYKYRIGNFETREEAFAVQELLRKSGYQDCFIVQF
jgi:hypothetical protein